MNINQNIVRIRTGTQMGSGILYPCEKEKVHDYKKHFIILTNKHVVEDLFDMTDKSCIKKIIEFDIYDESGELVDMGLISDIEIFNDKLLISDNQDEDIAAIIISFEVEIKIDLEVKLIWNDKNLNTIYIEGFPRVLYNNEISSKIQLQGKYKKIFPENKKIGIFKIIDDYHWYSNFKDLRLFQGFSGGPVYSIDKNLHFIVGLNQSILNIDDGENPFKLLYYYKIKYVLEYLREKGCIIFIRNEDDSASIRWIYGREEK